MISNLGMFGVDAFTAIIVPPQAAVTLVGRIADRVVPVGAGSDARPGVRPMMTLTLSDFAMPQMNGCQLVERLKQIASHVPMILLGDPQKMAGEMHSADALLAKKNCSPQELLERIKVMSARKRGPRKGSQRVAPVEELAVAS